MLRYYDWPGNVRELQNVIECAVGLGSTDIVLPEDLPADRFHHRAQAPNYLRTIEDNRRELVSQAMIKANYDYREAAAILGIHYKSMHRTLRGLDLLHLLKKQPS
jgi:transcriptional regulator of acetoin/glycerol metabolism